MNEDNIKNLEEKISQFDAIEILINDKQEILFEGAIDAPYIQLHYERIVKTARDFDNIKMIGHYYKKSKELIAEVFVSKEENNDE